MFFLSAVETSGEVERPRLFSRTIRIMSSGLQAQKRMQELKSMKN
jgi:hypothetical protein